MEATTTGKIELLKPLSGCPKDPFDVILSEAKDLIVLAEDLRIATNSPNWLAFPHTHEGVDEVLRFVQDDEAGGITGIDFSKPFRIKRPHSIYSTSVYFRP